MSNKKFKQCLIFGGETKSPDQDKIEEQLDELDKKRNFSPIVGNKRPSAYVQVFETMVRTVLECESDLLSVEEIGILELFSMLCYSARYCLVRLILRTSNRWYPISSLESFKKEVDEDGLAVAVQELCTLFANPKAEPIVPLKSEPPDVDVFVKQEDMSETIDLSMDLDDEDVKPFATGLPLTKDVFDELWPQRAGPSQLNQPVDSIRSLLTSDISTITMNSFCQDESAMTTREILDRINRDKLVTLAKQMGCKIRPNSKKDDIIDSLERQAANQQVLDFCTPLTQKAKGKLRADGLRQTQLSFAKVPSSSKPKKNQEQRLRELAIKYLGPCIRVNMEFYRLVRRLHIIYFRETEYPTDLLLPALLSTFKKRNFTPVTHKRTSQVWASRRELLEYERALELDKLLEDIAEEPKQSVPKRSKKTPASRRETPVTPSSGRDFSTLRTPASTNRQSTQPKSDWDTTTFFFENIDVDEEALQTTREQRTKKHFDDWLYPGWQELVAIEDEGVRPRPIGLERFDAGHVYTRMVHKALKVVAKLKEYQFELNILQALLDQRFWCRGKRAKWHTRRAIALGHLVTKEKDPLQKRDLQLQILEGVKVALLDDDTGIVYRLNLVKRLQDLEKRLKIPSEDRSQCSGELREAPFITLKAIRVQPLSFDAQGRPINDKENTPELHKYILVTKNDDKPAEDKPMRQTGKSTWQGKDGLVNVETRALEHYQDLGYKGFHCETRILTTLFGLLFWDVIFAEVLGAFETPYQAAPLDLLYDSFYRARKGMIDERLQEIQDGQAREILERHDKAHRDSAILCVGVNWEFCSREDLLDIVDCIGGPTLSIICQIFCENYDGRRSGGPDLFVWNVEAKKCKFVEVKGPGDTPQENQKLWFDSLLRANADVELCYVRDIARGDSTKRRTKTPSSSTRRGRATVAKDDPDSEEQDYDRMDCQDAESPTSERPKKRPRKEEVQPKFESPKDPSTMPDSSWIQTPPKRIRVRVEIDATPSKRKR